ncbi:Ankyrin repeat and KH domain-containing protein 1, partial [Parelaphostrongylus tenuis]
VLRRTLPTVAHSVNLSTMASQASLPPSAATMSGLVPALGVVQTPMSNPAVPSSSGFANLRRAHSEGDDLDITRATASQRAAFNVDKATESNNDTPLTLACSNGHAQMVDVLVCRGANIEHRDKKGFTPLILAATGGHRDVVELLLNSGAQIEAQSERTKDTALSLACSGGRKDVVELLLSRGANKEHRNVSDYTPLSLAASGGYVEIVNMLLNAGAEINSRTGSKLGISPLMLAAMNGHKEATRVLLEQGSDINAQIETNRNTALTLACFQGRTEVVGLLLQYNANVEHRAKTGLTPLMEAANGGYVEVGELLLDAAADPNTAPVPSSRDTALTIAADKGHERFVDMLVNRGALIDARNKKGCTALWLACHGGHLETVQTLVKHGADVDMQDNRKMSPLMVAFRKGHVKVVQHMVEHVRQFPGDQELSRYLTTINEPDLLQNCRECMDLIHFWLKRKRLRDPKKQAKLRKKEKKKEKKAKKQDFTEKERNVPAVTETPTRVQQSSPISRVKEESEEYSDDESDSLATKKEKTSATVDAMNNDRVPKMRAVEEPLLASVISERSNVSVNRQQKRSAIRRSRNESGKSTNNQTLTSLNSGVVASKNAIPSVLVSKNAVHTDEWVKASKKSKASSKPKNNSTACSVGKDFYLDDNYSGWKDVELSRRRSSTLSVGSSVIARVIGRGGANINAIREATGASIEVEKQSAVRRDQHDRQICIRGTQETVRNATQMINGLIADNDISVTEVIRQVLRGNTPSAVSSESGSRSNNMHDTKTTTLVTTTANSTTFSSSKPPMAPVTTNVWQQRMAARQREQQQQQQQQQQTVNVNTTTKETVSPTTLVTYPSVLDTVSSSASSVLNISSLNCTEPSLKYTSPSSASSISTSFPNKCDGNTIQASSVTTPVGLLNAQLHVDRELPRKAPGYRSPSIQTSCASMSTEQTVLSSASAPLSSIRCSIGSPPAPIAPPPGFASVTSHTSKSIPKKATVFQPSTTLDSTSIDVLPPPMISSHTRKLSSVNCPTTTASSGNDLSSLQFLDETTRAKLAEIWGNAKQDHSAQEQAWGNQVLLNSFSNLNIGNSSKDWSSTLHDNLFMNTPSSKGTTSVTTNQQSSLTPQTSSTLVGITSNSDWSVPTTKSMPLYARPQVRVSSGLQHTTGSSISSTVPNRTYNANSNSQPENNMLFNQLAAQLLIQQQGVSSTTVPPVQSYYPSPSYTDPAIIGMGHLSTGSSGTGGSNTSAGHAGVKSAYTNPYQAASNEYESLNSLLNSSFGHHQNGDFSISHQSSTYPSSPSVNRSLAAPRIQSNAGTFVPPPGFGSVASSQTTGLGGTANPTIPPPSLRPYYNAQMPPPTGLPLQPTQHASFPTFNSQPSSWMSSTHGKQQTGSLHQQQMPWWN